MISQLTGARASSRRLSGFVFLLLVIEFLDEFMFGIREAAWPLIRNDLNLSYVQIGLLTTIPGLVSNWVEPFIGIYGDLGRRKMLIGGGGIVVFLALIATALSPNFWIVMVVFVVWFPASGAFVSLAQASLMDNEPHRHQQNMARWTFAGSLGVVVGPAALSLGLALALGWREMFLIAAIFTVLAAWRVFAYPAQNYAPFVNIESEGESEEEESLSLVQGLRNALMAFKRPFVLRWLILLEFSDLMLDIMLGYLALYFVDVVGVSESRAAGAVAIGTGIGFIGDFLLIPLLERVKGLTYLRFSVVIELILYPSFLLVESWTLKLVILALIGFFNAGWYSILKGHLYGTMHGQSGTVMALQSVSGYIGVLLPVTLGAIATQFGLETMMWLLLTGPIVLLIGLPRDAPPPLMIDEI